MIKTTTEVSYDPINTDKKAIVFAQVTSALRNDTAETYTLNIKEWVEITYTENVPVYDENNIETMEERTFTKTQIVRNHSRVMTFVQADQLTNVIDQMFAPTETGTQLRKRYTILGHLLINKQENVRNTDWELCG